MKKSYFVFLDSDNANKVIPDYSSDLQFDLNANSLYDTENSYMSISSFSCPNIAYPVNSTNNKLYFKENGGPTKLVLLQEGSYDSVTITDTLQTDMNATGTFTYAVSYLAVSKRLDISATGNFQLVDGPNNAYELLGFDTQSIPTALNNVIVAPHPLNLSGTQYIDIEMNVNCKNYSSNLRNVFERIPVDVAFGSIIFHENVTDDFIDISSDSINNLEVRILNDKGQLWNLPNIAKVNLVLKISVMI